MFTFLVTQVAKQQECIQKIETEKTSCCDTKRAMHRSVEGKTTMTVNENKMKSLSKFAGVKTEN